LWLGSPRSKQDCSTSSGLVGHNEWKRNGQAEELVPQLLAHALKIGLTLAQVKEAMRTVGYNPNALDNLDRWESKRTTGTCGH
jgi:hypothetical protein